MNIFNFFHHTDDQNNVTAIHGTGAIDRPEHYLLPEAPQHAEIAGATQPANWVEKDPTTGFITYPKRNQGLQSSCTCYSAAKALSIDYLQASGIWRELSPDTVYPYVCEIGGGANSLNVMDYVVKQGMGVDALYPSDGLSEAQAEDKTAVPADEKIIATLYRPASIVQTPTDFETIASLLQSYQAQGIKKGITATIVGKNNGSWYSIMPNPPTSLNDPQNWYHRIIITDFGLINGQKVLAFDNSWGTMPGNKGQQFLTEAYQPFLYGGIYTIPQTDLSIATPVPKPSYVWSNTLQLGSTGPDVLALQKALQSLGFFPINSVISPTGYFGGITQNGLKTFQASFGLSQTGIVDEATIVALNNIFK